MIVVRFKVKCRPEKTEQAKAAFEAVVGPSREVEGSSASTSART
jgi:quinol monooxygenase YgiN